MHVSKSAVRFAVFWLALLLLGGAAARLQAQVGAPPESTWDVAEVERVLRTGIELERAQRWGEALAHYEEALRKHPHLHDLHQRLHLARLHYEVARRYADRSFLHVVREMDEFAALDLYGEVLLKIHAHYVEPPDWKTLVQSGAQAIGVACRESAFADRYGIRFDEAQVQQYLEQMAQFTESQQVRTRHEARDCAALVARMSQRELGLPPQAVLLEFVCAAGASLDEYSAFLTGDQLDEVLSQIEGNFVGLGIELKADQQSLLIVGVIPQGPAERGGIVAGDRIVEVNGQSMTEISTDVAADMLKGPEGSTVDLVLRSADNRRRALRLQRQRVEVPSIEDVSLVDRRYGVAYLRLTSFQKTTVRDLDAALWKLHRQGMRSLIVDLRRNPGGLLTASVDVADKFVSSGDIVSTRGRSTGEDYDYRSHLMGTWRVPLVVLIDDESASASEVFAAAIRDHRRGILVGTRSYGKGSVQGIFPMNSADVGLRLTTAKFYSPSGQPISRRGVQPDVVVHHTAKPSLEETPDNSEDDLVLQSAIQVALQQLNRR
jgi:carboxyl-terminal processing protease